MLPQLLNWFFLLCFRSLSVAGNFCIPLWYHWDYATHSGHFFSIKRRKTKVAMDTISWRSASVILLPVTSVPSPWQTNQRSDVKVSKDHTVSLDRQRVWPEFIQASIYKKSRKFIKAALVREYILTCTCCTKCCQNKRNLELVIEKF